MFINRKMKRKYQKKQHHNIYTKKYPSNRSRERQIALLKLNRTIIVSENKK